MFNRISRHFGGGLDEDYFPIVVLSDDDIVGPDIDERLAKSVDEVRSRIAWLERGLISPDEFCSDIDESLLRLDVFVEELGRKNKRRGLNPMDRYLFDQVIEQQAELSHMKYLAMDCKPEIQREIVHWNSVLEKLIGVAA